MLAARTGGVSWCPARTLKRGPCSLGAKNGCVRRRARRLRLRVRVQRASWLAAAKLSETRRICCLPLPPAPLRYHAQAHLEALPLLHQAVKLCDGVVLRVQLDEAGDVAHGRRQLAQLVVPHLEHLQVPAGGAGDKRRRQQQQARRGLRAACTPGAIRQPLSSPPKQPLSSGRTHINRFSAPGSLVIWLWLRFSTSSLARLEQTASGTTCEGATGGSVQGGTSDTCAPFLPVAAAYRDAVVGQVQYLKLLKLENLQ